MSVPRRAEPSRAQSDEDLVAEFFQREAASNPSLPSNPSRLRGPLFLALLVALGVLAYLFLF